LATCSASRATLDDKAGILLHQTWRMHADVCSYVSEVFYEGKVGSRENLGAQKVNTSGLFGGTGLLRSSPATRPAGRWHVN
jgi:uncharacterized protein